MCFAILMCTTTETLEVQQISLETPHLFYICFTSNDTQFSPTVINHTKEMIMRYDKES